MAWTDPITNRRPTDLAEAISDPRMLGDSLGARNVSDLNRIAANCAEIRNKLVANGKSPPALTQKMTWLETDLPYRASIQKILTDVNALRTAAGMTTGTKTPELPLNAYWKMNDLEKVIALIWQRLSLVVRMVFENENLYSEISESMAPHCNFSIVDGALTVRSTGPLENMRFEIDSSGDLHMIGEVV